jgi:TetR/AcrR family transcriptional repressor of mexJK operon
MHQRGNVMSHTSSNEKQNAILDAAQIRFARFGLQKVTMDEIASDLGMSKAALYYYFTTKEDIFRQVIIREQQLFCDRMIHLVGQEETAAGKLKTYALHFLDLFNELFNLKLISSDNMQGLKPVLRDLMKQLSESEYEFVHNIIASGVENGELNVESVEQTASLFIHIFQGLRFRYYKYQVNTDENKRQINIDSEIQLLAHLLSTGIQKRN